MVTHTAVIPVSERAGIEQKRSPLLLINFPLDSMCLSSKFQNFDGESKS